MKLVWSPDTASKAYIDTVKSCELQGDSGVAELISAMAAGWNAQFILETWSRNGAIATSIGLAIASRHTCGRHVCIVPDENTRSDYIQAMVKGNIKSPQVIVGEPDEILMDNGLVGIDFLVVDSQRKDFSKVLRLANLSTRGAVLICKNASCSKIHSGFKWRSILDCGSRRLVRSVFLPVGKGLDIAHVATSGGSGERKGDQRRWITHVDQHSGEEHVIRK